MTPHEADALEWSLSILNEAAHQLRRAHVENDDPDTIDDLLSDRDDASGNFIGRVRIYTTPEEDRPDALLDLAEELLAAHAQGHPTWHYGAVLGAIRAMKGHP